MSNNKPSQEDLKRRTEKEWRHRDHEMSWTQNLWVLITASQTMMLGIFALIASIDASVENNPHRVSTTMLFIVFLMTAIEIIILIALSFYRRFLDAGRADYFEESVSSAENSLPFKSKYRDIKYKDNDKRFRRCVRPTCEIVVCIILLTTMLFLFWSIQGNAPF